MNDEVSVDEIRSVVKSLGLNLVKDVAVRGESGIVHLFNYVVEGHGGCCCDTFVDVFYRGRCM